MKPLKPRNPWNHETYVTTKPFTQRNQWNHETTKPREKTQNLLKYETYETMKPIKPMCDETRHNSESFLTETNEHKQTWENRYKNNTLAIY